MQPHHLFIIDPIHTLHPKLDSTLRLVDQLQELGVECSYTTLEGISCQGGTTPAVAKALVQRFPSQPSQTLLQGKAPAGEPSLVELEAFDAIHMRKDPPFDMAYISATWLLDTVAESTWVLNHPAALKGLNEKLSILAFPEHTAPALASAEVEQIEAFIEASRGDAVLKPLHLFGGRGIHRIQSDELDRKSLLDSIRRALKEAGGTLLVQPFNHSIFSGEIRAFAVCGQPVGWCLKQPKDGEFLANTHAGAELKPYTPTPKIEAMVRDVSTRLMRAGVYVVGFDIIGEQISELNITSPRLLQASSQESSHLAYQAAAVALRDLTAEPPRSGHVSPWGRLVEVGAS